MEKNKYKSMVDKHTPKEDVLYNAIIAFITGGIMGIVGQGLIDFYSYYLTIPSKEATVCMLVTLIFLSCLFTSLGFFDKWVNFAKCGLIIPITGFAHATMSAALEYRKEGLVTGIGANMLKLSGAVVIFGVVSAWTFSLIRMVVGVIEVTCKYKTVYLNETATVTGPYEAKGPLSKYFDRSYDDLYFNAPTWEQAESKSISDAVDILLGKAGMTRFDIDMFISGDLLNQLTASNYAAANMPSSFMGVYAACATSTLGLATGANLVEGGMADKVLCATSSHNNGAEKQFRYPVEYGGPKPKTTTFTSTGSAVALLSSKKSNIKIDSSTIGTVIDSEINDVFNMGAVMAPAAADTIYKHLMDTGRNIDYYDLVLTGDLGIYGKEILKEYMQTEYGISLD